MLAVVVGLHNDVVSCQLARQGPSVVMELIANKAIVDIRLRRRPVLPLVGHFKYSSQCHPTAPVESLWVGLYAFLTSPVPGHYVQI